MRPDRGHTPLAAATETHTPLCALRYSKYLDEDKNKERALNTDAFGEAVFDFEQQIGVLMEVRTRLHEQAHTAGAPVRARAATACLLTGGHLALWLATACVRACGCLP